MRRAFVSPRHVFVLATQSCSDWTLTELFSGFLRAAIGMTVCIPRECTPNSAECHSCTYKMGFFWLPDPTPGYGCAIVVWNVPVGLFEVNWLQLLTCFGESVSNYQFTQRHKVNKRRVANLEYDNFETKTTLSIRTLISGVCAKRSIQTDVLCELCAHEYDWEQRPRNAMRCKWHINKADAFERHQRILNAIITFYVFRSAKVMA